MTRSCDTAIRHPPQGSARFVRALRALARLRGWRRAAALLAAPGAGGAFTIANDGVLFSGDLSSYLDREIYLFGGYETAALEGFLRHAPAERRGVALDVGANAGAHSLYLARRFATVHAFDPNPALWNQFERNMALNGFANVTLHRIGLGREDGVAPLYDVDGDNAGLATLSSAPQYDRPLRCVGQTAVARGDTVMARLGAPRVDAVKIDVQGYEALVLQGLSAVLARDQPLVWVEAGGQAPEAITTLRALKALFPYPVEVVRFHGVRGWLTHGWVTTPACELLAPGDYWVMPAA